MSKLRRGIFITLEGPDGAGKSTQGKGLSAWLSRQGYKVLFTREPGGTDLGKRLRRFLLDRRYQGIDSFMELCLYEASRAALVSQVIRPALKRGWIVVADRFQDSTWVYQGFAGGVALKTVEAMGHAATGGVVPDLTILLDLPAAKGLARVRNPNRMEGKPLAFHRRVRLGYLALARRERNRIRVVRADLPKAEVEKGIHQQVQNVLEKYRRA